MYKLGYLVVIIIAFLMRFWEGAPDFVIAYLLFMTCGVAHILSIKGSSHKPDALVIGGIWILLSIISYNGLTFDYPLNIHPSDMNATTIVFLFFLWFFAHRDRFMGGDEKIAVSRNNCGKPDEIVGWIKCYNHVRQDGIDKLHERKSNAVQLDNLLSLSRSSAFMMRFALTLYFMICLSDLLWLWFMGENTMPKEASLVIIPSIITFILVFTGPAYLQEKDGAFTLHWWRPTGESVFVGPLSVKQYKKFKRTVNSWREP